MICDNKEKTLSMHQSLLSFFPSIVFRLEKLLLCRSNFLESWFAKGRVLIFVFLSPPAADPISSMSLLFACARLGNLWDRSQWHHPLPIKEVNQAKGNQHPQKTRSQQTRSDTNECNSSHPKIHSRSHVQNTQHSAQWVKILY